MHIQYTQHAYTHINTCIYNIHNTHTCIYTCVCVVYVVYACMCIYYIYAIYALIQHAYIHTDGLEIHTATYFYIDTTHTICMMRRSVNVSGVGDIWNYLSVSFDINCFGDIEHMSFCLLDLACLVTIQYQFQYQIWHVQSTSSTSSSTRSGLSSHHLVLVLVLHLAFLVIIQYQIWPVQSSSSTSSSTRSGLSSHTYATYPTCIKKHTRDQSSRGWGLAEGGRGSSLQECFSFFIILYRPITAEVRCQRSFNNVLTNYRRLQVILAKTNFLIGLYI